MGVDDDRPEFWFQLYGITALVSLAITVVPIAKLSHICDKYAKMCRHPLAFLPSIVPLTIGALTYVGLMVAATFVHVDEGKPASDDYYDETNWIVYVVLLLSILWPHLYTVDYYNSKRWRKYIFSSYRYIATISNFAYWASFVISTILMLVAVILAGLDSRWTAMGLYIGVTFLLLANSIYFTLEWVWCGGVFRRINAYYRGSKTVIEVIEVMERDAAQAQMSGVTVTQTRRTGMLGYPMKRY
jgi:hypothetical protein